MLENIRIVLVHTSHPGNIGAAARAMKTMGLSDLALVQPKSFPDEEATTRASGAENILESARQCNDLDQALEGCQLVIGTTARDRSIASEPLLPPLAAEQAIKRAATGERVAILFGRERSGLTNEELDRCQLSVHIPANPEYSSLNLGSAVQVLSYALRMASLELSDTPLTEPPPEKHALDQLAGANVKESFYRHLESVMTDMGFLQQTNPTLIMRRLRCLYDRSEPTVRELNILRGMLSATEKQLSLKGDTETNNDSD